jgi:CheY-like chemotaxis protein
MRLQDIFDVIRARDGAQALALAVQEKPAAILLDLSLPDYSGFELCQTFSTLSYTRSIPIFVVSGNPAEKYKAFCQNLGAASYFEKPVDFTDLRAHLSAATKQNAVTHAPEMRIRLRVALKLRGVDQLGQKFDLMTATDGVSSSGFVCTCAGPLKKDLEVDVFLAVGAGNYVGRARAVNAEWHGTPTPRYTFRFTQSPNQWVV